MNRIILITRPSHDITTHYLSKWCCKIIECAGKKSIQILDLEKSKANRKELESRIKKMQPQFVIFNGHGNIDRIGGHDDEILIKVGDNDKILKAKLIYAISCKSAKTLGVKSIKSGAISYIGYKDDFIFCYDTHKVARPLNDKIVKLFLEPSNQVAISLIKGNTCGEASERSKEKFNRNIHKLLTSESQLNVNHYVKYLWWDMKNQVCLGDENAKFE